MGKLVRIDRERARLNAADDRHAWRVFTTQLRWARRRHTRLVRLLDALEAELARRRAQPQRRAQ